MEGNKDYVAPNVEVFEIEMSEIIASSVCGEIQPPGLDESYDDDSGRSIRRSFWDQDSSF